MKKPLLYAICAIAIVLMVGSAIAAERTIVRQITGDVVTLDVSINTLTIRGKKAEVVIVADEKTTVKIGKEKKTLSDIKVGDRVIVKYVETQGKKTARSIEIKTATTGKK